MTANYPSSMGGSEVVFLAAGPPTATDDATTCGAREGNRWHDQTADEWWICSSATTGAAVWQRLATATAAGVAIRNTGTATAVTHATTDGTLVMAPSATCTLTLLAAATYPGRILRLKLTTAFAVNSPTSNVVPLTSTTAGTVILAATVGKYATLQSNGTNWEIIEAN